MCDADPFALFDSLLDGAINVVQLVEREAGRLTDGQRYQVVVKSLCLWAWGQLEGDMNLGKMNVWIAVSNPDNTYQGFLNYFESKYNLRPTGNSPPIQQYLDDVRDLGEQINKIWRKEKDGT